MSSKKQEYYVKKFNFCDRNHFWMIKGIGILAALITAFCQDFLQIGYELPISKMTAALFVLCSGFGVSESFQKKKGLVHYWENKLIRVWIPSVTIVLLLNIIESGNVASWIAQTPLGFKGNMLYVIFGGYAVFWLMFQFADNKGARIAGIFLCAAAVFALLPEDMGIKLYLFAFPVGVLLSQSGWKRSLSQAGWGIRILELVICLVLAVGGWFLADNLEIPYVKTLLYNVCFIAAAMSLMLLTFCLKNIPIWGIFVPFGWIAYALYLIYDGVFRMFAGKNDPKMYMVMFVVIFVVAALITWLRELLISWNYKMRRKGRTHLKGSMG